MSLDDVPPDEMERHPDDVNDELERLLTGQPLAGSTASGLGAVLTDLTAAFPARPLDREDEHLAAMVEAAHLLADNGNPAMRPVSNADAPAPQASRLPKRRRNPMMKVLLTKVLAPVVVAFTAMGGMAYAGVLPEPIQRLAADTAAVVGIDLPDPDDDAIVPAVDVSETEAPEVEDGDDQGEDGDHQGEDGDDQGDVGSGDDQGENGDDQGAVGSGDDQGEDADHQGDVGSGDDQGEDDDHHGEDGDDQGEDDDDQGDSNEDDGSDEVGSGDEDN